ncbi:MAG: hypothetical protein FWF94_05630 [Oscillospiraceae bacterium]|nr:hypothetical protein [Oscillospiraceae bacterium]
MKNHKKILWVTQSALFIALLVAWQWFSRILFPATTLVTGSGVNFILIIAATVCSFRTGLCVAAISPFMAALLNITPNWILVPFLILGNIALVTVWSLTERKELKGYSVLAVRIIALVTAAVIKFGVLYTGVVKIAVELFEILPAPMVIPFSFPQLFTAIIGGGLALIIIPVLYRLTIKSNS